MQETNILVIGSSAAGLVAATTAKRTYKDKRVIVVTTQKTTMIPCGIPYIFGTVEKTENNVIPAQMMCEKTGVEFLVDEVLKIDKEERTVTLCSSEKIKYEKLVIGTGSTPLIPGWLEGTELEKVYTVPKNKAYLDIMNSQLKEAKDIIVIGAGFIGVELSDELNKAGKKVKLIEKLPHILGLAFDEDISLRVETLIKDRGVELLTGLGVKKIIGNTNAEGVVLEDGSELKADAIVLSMGYRPNTKLAIEAGLPMGERGSIKVDEYLRTENSSIFAVGDCAEKHDFLTRKPSPVMLASTACAEARTAGMNLYGLSTVKTFSGTISIFATALGTNGFGVAGLTETIAKKEGFEFVTGVFEGIDRHPGTLKDAHKQFIKLIVAKDSGVILGGEVCSGLSTGELTNLIGIIIQNKMTVLSLLTAQMGTHPLLTASPAGIPLIKAAENAVSKL